MFFYFFEQSSSSFSDFYIKNYINDDWELMADLFWYTFLVWPNRYFEGGVSSVYLWDLEDGGFAGVVVLKKGEQSNIIY